MADLKDATKQIIIDNYQSHVEHYGDVAVDVGLVDADKAAAEIIQYLADQHIEGLPELTKTYDMTGAGTQTERARQAGFNEGIRAQLTHNVIEHTLARAIIAAKDQRIKRLEAKLEKANQDKNAWHQEFDTCNHHKHGAEKNLVKAQEQIAALIKERDGLKEVLLTEVEQDVLDRGWRVISNLEEADGDSGYTPILMKLKAQAALSGQGKE